MTLDEFLDSADWRIIFDTYTCATHVKTKEQRIFLRIDVAKVLAAEDGENDGAHWIGLFKTQCYDDGRFLYLTVRAWCDYTGWDCQADGNADWADTLADAIAFGLTHEERTRLKSQLFNLQEV